MWYKGTSGRSAAWLLPSFFILCWLHEWTDHLLCCPAQTEPLPGNAAPICTRTREKNEPCCNANSSKVGSWGPCKAAVASADGEWARQEFVSHHPIEVHKLLRKLAVYVSSQGQLSWGVVALFTEDCVFVVPEIWLGLSLSSLQWGVSPARSRRQESSSMTWHVKL